MVSAELDPPAERVDTAAFLAKSLADSLHERLASRGLACTRIVVEAETEHGETLVRSWRHEGTLSPGAIADRVRWQLDGWLSGAASVRPTAGISRLSLVPDEVVAARGRQLGFWGGETLIDERVVRAIARVQGLLGIDAVTVPECRGGRGPGEQVALIPAAAVDLTASRPQARLGAVGRALAGPGADPGSRHRACRAAPGGCPRRRRTSGRGHRAGDRDRSAGQSGDRRPGLGCGHRLGRSLARRRALVGPSPSPSSGALPGHPGRWGRPSPRRRVRSLVARGDVLSHGHFSWTSSDASGTRGSQHSVGEKGGTTVNSRDTAHPNPRVVSP